MSTPDTPQSDPQTHLDTDPVNDPAQGSDAPSRDDQVDPAHDTGEDEGWTSEGGSTPEGPATAT